MPDEPEAYGLLSLMVLHNSRRRARLDESGELIPLEDQDRSLWDDESIRDGCTLLDRASHSGRRGPYQLLAAIAACHATAPTAGETDWSAVAGLYGHLYRMNPSPVVALNRAVAVAMSDGPAEGLGLVDEVEAEGALSNYYRLPATRADLLRRLGRTEEAEVAYRSAIGMAPSDPERRFMCRRIAELHRQG
jgi:RNA polymerase sigma-70 factor (ECF subfamily)